MWQVSSVMVRAAPDQMSQEFTLESFYLLIGSRVLSMNQVNFTNTTFYWRKNKFKLLNDNSFQIFAFNVTNF